LRDGHSEQDDRGEQYEFQHVRHRLGIDRVGTLAEGYCSRWKGTTRQVESGAEGGLQQWRGSGACPLVANSAIVTLSRSARCCGVLAFNNGRMTA
jgi:hypothetical protein